jgi:hypothetical protein
MQRIYGICGLAGSGKDTIANILIDKHGYVKLSFGGVLKDIAATIFSWDRELLEGATIESRKWREEVDPWWSERLQINHLTPRKALQYIGTDLFRHHFHDDIWVACVERKLSLYPRVVITDCRFPNEIKLIRKAGGKIIRVQRGELPGWFPLYEKGILDVPDGVHPSEYMWIRESFDVLVANDGCIDDLKRLVDELDSSR